MKKIVLKQGSKGAEFFEAIKRKNTELKKKMIEMHPPKDIIEAINLKTEETNRINNGRLDKGSFRLGMYSMWHILHSKNMINNKIK